MASKPDHPPLVRRVNRAALPCGQGGKKQNSWRKNAAINTFMTDDYADTYEMR
jgi:hypothetical protein